LDAYPERANRPDSHRDRRQELLAGTGRKLAGTEAANAVGTSLGRGLKSLDLRRNPSFRTLSFRREMAA
jgi:hypothetical protein